MSASDIIAQTTADAQRLFDRVSNASKKKQKSIQSSADVGYLVTLSIDHERFGGGSGPLSVGETATIVRSEDGESLRLS
jgi:hypothetical protein